MSKQPTNPAHQFPGAKELASLPPDLQSRLMLSLQGQAPKKNYPTHHTLIHPPPDMSDLNMFQPSKKLKTDDNALNMLLDPQAAAAMSLFPGFASANKQQIEIPSVQEPLIVPELRPLGFDAQSQALRQGKGRNQATGGFPGFESQARGQMSQLAEAGFPGLGSLLPGGGAEDLLMSSQNLAREQALKNMLLMQALQNPNDILTNRLLQAQAQQQAQAQLLGHPSYQLQQSMRLPGYNGVNPMTLQYLELQKRLQSDLALMQAQAQAAQAMQAAQRMQGPSQSLSESLNGRFRMEGLPGENLIKLESGLQFPLGLDPQLRMLYNEQLGGQKRRDDIPELYERLARDAEVKREDIGAQLGLHQQQQQSLRQQQQRHEEKLQQQQQQQQLKKNGEKAMNGFAQVEREVRPQKEARIEQPKIEQKVAPRNEPRIDPMEEELKGRSVVKTTAVRGKPVREVPVVAPKPVRNVPPQQPLTVNPRSARDTRESRDARERESRRTSSRLQGSQIKYDLDSEEEEEKVMPVTRSNNARNTRSSNRKQDTTPTQVKPVVINVHVPSTMIKSTPQEKGPTIIQPKEQFTAKFFGDYLIEVYLRKENIKTNFKRTPLGRAHQIYVHDCTLNDDEEEDDLPMRKPCNLISAPVYNPEDEVEEIQLIPHTETPGPHVIKAKEIKVGEDHQAYIPELNLNAQMELHQRPLKLLVSPNNV